MLLPALLLLGVGAAAAPPPAHRCSGGVVYAEDCGPGFAAADSTAALQAALDSPAAHTVWVRNVSGLPWIITPVFLRSNQTVRFGARALVLAKRGEFHSKTASLLNLGCPDASHGLCHRASPTNVSLLGEPGATLRMWRSDYGNLSLYSKAEWRHGVNIAGGSKGVRVEGLTIELTGGARPLATDVPPCCVPHAAGAVLQATASASATAAARRLTWSCGTWCATATTARA